MFSLAIWQKEIGIVVYLSRMFCPTEKLGKWDQYHGIWSEVCH